MIHLAIGRQGSGKTLMLVKLAEECMKSNKQVYSNIHFNFPYKPLDYNDIIECNLKDCSVFIDEIHLLLSARRWHSKINQKICDNFLSMARKQNTEVHGTTQTLRKVDIRFREEADYIYYCKKYVYDANNQRWNEVLHTFPFPKEVPILIDIEREDTYSHEIERYHFIGNDYFDKFDTYQVVKIEGLPE